MSVRFLVLPKHFSPFLGVFLGIVLNILILYGVFFVFSFEKILPEKWQLQYFWIAFLACVLVNVVVWFCVLSSFFSQRVLVGEDGIIFIKKYKEHHVAFCDIGEIKVQKIGFFANLFGYGTLVFVTKKGDFSFPYCPHPIKTVQTLLQTIQK